MRAARLHEFGKELQIDQVPAPVPGTGEVLVRVEAAGVCHSDLHSIAGSNPKLRLPITLGHETAGVIETVGGGVREFRRGDHVAVYSAWGCGACRFCQLGEYQVCDKSRWAGYGPDGGFADFLRVPSTAYLVRLDGAIDPAQAAPLTDAGLTSYHAVRKTLQYLYPGATAAILGAGGLGHLGVQIMRTIGPDTKIIAIDVAEDKLALASRLGADHTLKSHDQVDREVKSLTGGEGAQAVIDYVGTDATLRIAARAVGRKGIIVLVGLAGGSLPFSFQSVPSDCTLAKNSWGTYGELVEVLQLAKSGRIRVTVERFSLEGINDALGRLERGGIPGRAVVVP